MKITEVQVAEIKRIMFETLGASEPQLHANYSGRGMFGKTCVGFVVKPHEPAALGAAVALALADHPELVRNMMLSLNSDDMGRNTIVYFPTVTLED